MALKFNPFSGTFDFIKDPTFSVVSITGTTSASVNKTYLASGGAYTITFPATHSANDYIIVKDSGGDASTNNKTISGGGNNIDGVSSDTINSDYGSNIYVSNGTNWFKI